MPKQPKLTTPETDPRHPDTVADQPPAGDVVEPLEPQDVTPDVLAQLDPATYGFTNIDTEQAVKNATAGPGVVDPVPAVAVASDQNSTFAQRAAARRKVVGDATEGVARK